MGDRELLTPVAGVKSVECPVSLLSRGNGPQIRQQALTVLDAQMIHQTTGQFPGGPDPFKWSARWYDLVMMGQNEVLRVKAAREEIADNATRLPR